MVYVISDGEYIKIGVTKNTLKTRLVSLQTGNPRKLFPVYEIHTDSYRDDCKLEKVLHNEFWKHMILFEDGKPTEWFGNEVKGLFDAKNILFWKELNAKYGTAFNVEILDGSDRVQMTNSREELLKRAISGDLRNDVSNRAKTPKRLMRFRARRLKRSYDPHVPLSSFDFCRSGFKQRLDREISMEKSKVDDLKCRRNGVKKLINNKSDTCLLLKLHERRLEVLQSIKMSLGDDKAMSVYTINLYELDVMLPKVNKEVTTFESMLRRLVRGVKRCTKSKSAIA